MGTQCGCVALLVACAVVSSTALNPSLGFAGCPKTFLPGATSAGLTRLVKAAGGSPTLGIAQDLCLHGQRRRRVGSEVSKVCMSATADEKQKEQSASGVKDDERLLGSRRLAAASKVLVHGSSDADHKTLLGSKRLSEASEILWKTPRDRNRMLGSTRLRKAREILFRGVSGDGTSSSPPKMLGSKRLASARNVLARGFRPLEEANCADSVEENCVLEELPIVSAQTDEGVRTGRIGSAEFTIPEPKGPLQFGGIIATAEEIKEVANIRKLIKEIPAEEREKMTNWVDEMLDVDIFRYVHQFKNKAFEKIKETAVFRKEEGIDNILQTDAEKFENYFAPGREEIVYLAPDKQGRPILLYRSAYHKVGLLEPKEYTRYILYQTEKTRLRNGLGITRQSCVLVDRVGSTGKNQDPALLKVLLPTVLNHYPMYIGNVYIAPISTVFFIVWTLVKLLLDEATKKRFFLLKDDYTAQLLQIVEKEALPSTLGGDLDVPEFCAKQRNLDKAQEQLAELEKQMDQMEGGESAEGRTLKFDGKSGTEEEIMGVAELRINVASLTQEEHNKYGNWLQSLQNEDLLRFLRVHRTADLAWAALRATAEWRVGNRINTILDEDLSSTFEKGKQEIYLLPPDKMGRPVVVYRSGIHFPGKIPNKDFVRFTLQVVERSRKEYGVGIKTPVCILVDRVGSGRENQDIGLLQDLLPTLQTHYPQTVGAIYIAPINWVFFLIWSLASLLFDEDTKQRVHLVRGDIAQELKQTIPLEVLPKNMGGTRVVPEAGVN